MSTAADQAYRTIRAEVIGGGLAPGTPLPEEQLAAICGVSRTPVREAIRRLEAEGFIRMTGSGRALVADSSLESIRDTFELRTLLESHAAARAAVRITPPALTALRTVNAAIQDAIAPPAPDVAHFAEENRRFHEIIVTEAASAPLRRALAGVVEQPVVLRTARLYDRAELDRSLAEHAELIEAFARGDPEWASAVMSAHIRRAAHAYAAAVERARENCIQSAPDAA